MKSPKPFLDLGEVATWISENVTDPPRGFEHEEYRKEIVRVLHMQTKYMQGVDLAGEPSWHTPEVAYVRRAASWVLDPRLGQGQ